MALNGLFSADVPLRNYSLTHWIWMHYFACVCYLFILFFA